MSDIEKSFNYLHDNIPQWFQDVAAVEEKIVKMQSELAKVPVSRSPPMKRKTGSVESIRGLDAIREEPGSSTAAHSSPFTSRKRKTPSVLSGQASGPSKYRSRTMVVVYYDGQIQKSFETLVRAIGTGRNMLRKGKMAAKMDEMAALAGSDDDDDDDDDDDAVMSKIGYRHRTGLSSMRTRAAMMRSGRGPNNSNSTPVGLFDSTDKALEQAQGLCERAAHQSLREGDCRKELDGVRKHFEEVLETAKKEVTKYAERKEKEAQQAAQQELIVKLQTPIPAPVPESKAILPAEIRPATGTTPTTTKVVDIEVDDEEDDEDDIDFVMPPIRLTSRV
ncbi:hypothetical protein BU26DRAFT_305577 [Trematosphaeria pertusa]|uniref:Uncharacterized protein n=1 Tax=Trematosphaeria pertusa TaxID=390896 RepID=A0A6A6IDW2_9PLEO|nr:uncharacterized protein BU26DRAFT_305577 [Trematosphaeria pertusa]KAF2248774.1 hypothetical protein BU26DRAFT_305577 [Trematosphaeria pertusa]